MNSILQGLRVIESSAFIAAPFAGMTLAQMGAEVIRVDPIGGGLDYGRWPLAPNGASLYWAGLNKAKRSVCLDLRQERGREILAALITAPGERAGIFLTNLPAEGPLRYAALQARRADTIMVSIIGRRDGGVAVDYTVNASVGFPLVTGPADYSGPVNSVVPTWDLLAGQSAALAVLAAERHRHDTGAGQHIRLALEDVALATAGHLGYLAEAALTGADRPRLGNDIYGTFGRDFVTRDGRRIMVVAFTPKQWRALGQATGLDEAFATLERLLGLDFRREGDRYKGRGAIGAIVEKWIGERDLAQIRAAFAGTGVCWAPYRSFRELVASDPRCSPANPLFAEVEQPGVGRYAMPGCWIDFGASARGPTRPAPVLGADTDAVLAAVLGLSEREISDLHDHKIVSGPSAAEGV